MIHCGGGGGLCRVTLMKLIVFVEFCLIPNCFLPTIEVGGQVCSQNNFLPQERQHTRKGNRAVDAFLEFVKNLSRLHWLVYQESGCDSHQKVSNRCQGCSEKSSRPVYQLFDSETMKGWKLHLFFVSAFLVLPLKRAVWVLFVEKCPKFKKHFHICSQCLILQFCGILVQTKRLHLCNSAPSFLNLSLSFSFSFSNSWAENQQI